MDLHVPSIVTKSLCETNNSAKAYQAIEHKMEEDFNGLLVNNWLNCDVSAASKLLQVEREQLETTRLQTHCARPTTRKTPSCDIEADLTEKIVPSFEHNKDSIGKRQSSGDVIAMDYSGSGWLQEPSAEQSEPGSEKPHGKGEIASEGGASGYQSADGAIMSACARDTLCGVRLSHPEQKGGMHLNMCPRRLSLHKKTADALSVSTSNDRSARGPLQANL